MEEKKKKETEVVEVIENEEIEDFYEDVADNIVTERTGK